MALLPTFTPWTPAQNTSGMVCWWDAADLSTTTLNAGNDRLVQWRDKSPLGAPAHLTPFKAFGGPLITTLNGLRAFSFFDAGMRTAANYFAFNDFTIFVAFAPPTPASSYERLIDHNLSTGWWIGRNTTTAAWLGGIIEPGAPYGISVPLPDNRSVQISMRRVGSTQTLLGNGGGRLDRTVPATQTSPQLIALATIFNDTGVGSGAMNNFGIIGEVLIWARALSDGEMRQTEGFLAHKWGSADLLPGDHPFKSAAPGHYLAPGAAGAFALAGQSAGLRAARQQRVTTGTITAAGQATRLSAARRLSATSSAITLAGQPAALRQDLRLTVEPGDIAATGSSAALTYAETDDPRLSALTGELALTGNSINLAYAPRPPVHYRMDVLPGAIGLGCPSAYLERSAVQPGVLRFGLRVDLGRW